MKLLRSTGLIVAASAFVTAGALGVVAACGEDAPQLVSLGDSGLAGASPIIFVRADGTEEIAQACPIVTDSIVANGVAVGTLRLDTQGWNLANTDSFPVRVSAYDALVSIYSPGNGNVSDGAPPSDGEVTGILSASSPTLDVSVRVGLVTGVTRLTVSGGRFTQDVCLALSPNPVTALGLTVTPIDGPDSGAYTVSATLVTSDGTSPSLGTAIGWNATNCAALSFPRTVVVDGGTTTNTLYVPPGWTGPPPLG